MKDANTKLQERLAEEKRAISEVAGEIKAFQSNLTLEQIKEKDTKLKKEVMELEEKLEKLQGGVTLVKPEDRKIIKQMYSDKMTQWRKRKRIFKDLWDTITENSLKDIKEFKICWLLCYSSSWMLSCFSS